MTPKHIWERCVAVGSVDTEAQRRWHDQLWLIVCAAVSGVFVAQMSTHFAATLQTTRFSAWLGTALLLHGTLSTLLALWLLWRMPQRTPTAVERRQGRIVATICVLLLACFGVVTVLAPLVTAVDVMVVLANAMILAVTGQALWLVRRGLVRSSAAVLVGQLVIHLLSSPGQDSTYIMILTILVGGLLARWWVGLVLATGLPLLFTALQAAALAPGVADWRMMLQYIITMNVIAGLVAVYARSLETALTVADQRATALAAAQHTLQAAYAEIEQRVHERTAALSESEQRLRTALAQVEELSQIDDLTKLYNRRAGHLLGTEALARAAHNDGVVSVLVVDVDHFKRVNDTYGHAVGDRVLQSVAHQLRAMTRSGDLVARYGGEEFVVVLPNTPLASAHYVAERMRQAIAKAPVAVDQIVVPVTVSVGVVQCGPACTDLDTVLAQADAALYQAKNAGRNRVVVQQTDLAVATMHDVAAM